MQRALGIFTQFFVVWVALFSAAAYLFPTPFAMLKPGIVPGLGLIMFGMGMTLTPGDFARVVRMPRAVGCGVIGQFVIMPLVAMSLVKAAGLRPELAMGFIILGCCPGGTASNVVAYLARADVALSVTMTACSTLAAIVLTPLLTGWLGGQFLPVDRWGLFLDVVKMVLLPVALGMGLRIWLGEKLKGVLAVFPAISVLVIVLIIACVVALTKDRLSQAVGLVGVLVLAQNGLGLGLGYLSAWAVRLPPQARRTVAIEVGMQNSGLGVALATAHFASHLVALPAAVFSVIHNVTGALLATLWQRSRAASAGRS